VLREPPASPTVFLLGRGRGVKEDGGAAAAAAHARASCAHTRTRFCSGAVNACLLPVGHITAAHLPAPPKPAPAAHCTAAVACSSVAATVYSWMDGGERY